MFSSRRKKRQGHQCLINSHDFDLHSQACRPMVRVSVYRTTHSSESCAFTVTRSSLGHECDSGVWVCRRWVRAASPVSSCACAGRPQSHGLHDTADPSTTRSRDDPFSPNCAPYRMFRALAFRSSSSRRF